MADEFALQRDVSRAHQAKTLLDNSLLKEAFEVLEKAYIETWRATQIHDEASRERLFLAVNIVGKVRDHLHKVVSNGSVAQADLRQLEREFERKKKFGII